MKQIQVPPTSKQLPTKVRNHIWRHAWWIIRQVLGWIFILLGIAGMILPVLQGVLFLVIGIALVGRRNIVLRWCAVRIKRFVRRWAALETPVIGWLGRVALRAQHTTSHQRRRLMWWYTEKYGTRNVV